jgi:hypothetical protein
MGVKLYLPMLVWRPAPSKTFNMSSVTVFLGYLEVSKVSFNLNR